MINSYRYESEKGTLKLVDTIYSLPDDFNGDSIAADIHVHPNGKFLYASNRGHDSLIICNIKEEDGTLKYIAHQLSLGQHPRNFSIDPIIDLLLVAGDAAGNSLTMASRSKFYEEAAWELLKARTILCSSYVYGYFHLEEHKTSKSWFELMQHELEDMTEKLSEMLQVKSINLPI